MARFLVLPLALTAALGSALLVGCKTQRAAPSTAPAAPATAAWAGASAPTAQPPAPTYPPPVSAPAASPVRGWRGGVALEGRDLPFDQVLARSRSTGRPVMLWFLASWCGYCRKLESQTMPDASVGAHVSGYLNVRYD